MSVHVTKQNRSFRAMKQRVFKRVLEPDRFHQRQAPVPTPGRLLFVTVVVLWVFRMAARARRGKEKLGLMFAFPPPACIDRPR